MRKQQNGEESSCENTVEEYEFLQNTIMCV